MGKPIRQSLEEVDLSVERALFYQDTAVEALQEEIIETTKMFTKRVIKEPKGVVLILSSFSFPLLDSVNHIIPALLAGNSILLKDNPRTPLIGKHLEKPIADTNILQHFFANQLSIKEIYSHRSINYVVFMGSLESAHDVYMEVANNDFLDVQLDMGGKDSAYIAPDAD